MLSPPVDTGSVFPRVTPRSSLEADQDTNPDLAAAFNITYPSDPCVCLSERALQHSAPSHTHTHFRSFPHFLSLWWPLPSTRNLKMGLPLGIHPHSGGGSPRPLEGQMLSHWWVGSFPSTQGLSRPKHGSPATGLWVRGNTGEVEPLLRLEGDSHTAHCMG